MSQEFDPQHYNDETEAACAEDVSPESNELECELQEDRERVIQFFERAMHILLAYQSHQRGEVELRGSLRAMALALGFTLVAGAEGPAELARRCGWDKQAMNKCVLHFIEQLKLSPLPGQRDQNSRENMSKARKQQLVGKVTYHNGRPNLKQLKPK